MFNSFFATIFLIVTAAEGVTPVGTPAWVPITIIVILLLLFLWGLTRNAIPTGTAVSPPSDHHDHSHDDHHDHEEAEPAHAQKTIVPDDLKKIEGIGPKIASVLQQAGIQTFADLAAAGVTELERIVRVDAGITIAFPDTWPEQAALARDGEWERLEKLQDELQGGRRE